MHSGVEKLGQTAWNARRDRDTLRMTMGRERPGPASVTAEA